MTSGNRLLMFSSSHTRLHRFIAYWFYYETILVIDDLDISMDVIQ